MSESSLSSSASYHQTYQLASSQSPLEGFEVIFDFLDRFNLPICCSQQAFWLSDSKTLFSDLVDKRLAVVLTVPDSVCRMIESDLTFTRLIDAAENRLRLWKLPTLAEGDGIRLAGPRRPPCGVQPRC
jgi:hypothetical protein